MTFNKDFLYRQKDLINFDTLGVPITIIGCGGIGSHTILSLARMGFYNQQVWDFDEVDKFNLNNQGFNIEDIGKNKAECMAEKVAAAIGFKIKAFNKYFTANETPKGIIIAAVDSMEARKNIMKAAEKSGALFINPAMGAEYAKIRVYDLAKQDEVKNFYDTWYSDEDAVPEACTSKSTIYTTNLISGLLCKIVKDYVTEQPYTASVDWNITKNSMSSFDSLGNEL